MVSREVPWARLSIEGATSRLVSRVGRFAGEQRSVASRHLQVLRPVGSATARRDVCELTPASSRSQARADWLHRRVVQAMRSSQDLPTHAADRKPLIDEGVFDHLDHGPVGHLRKTLWSTCRQRCGQAWISLPGGFLSTSVHTLSLDRLPDHPPIALSRIPADPIAWEVVPNLHHPYGS